MNLRTITGVKKPGVKPVSKPVGKPPVAAPLRKKFVPPPEVEEQAEAEEPVTDLDAMNREELKHLIAESGLPVKVFKSMTDDDIRQAIATAVKAAEETEAAAPEEEEEAASEESGEAEEPTGEEGGESEESGEESAESEESSEAGESEEAESEAGGESEEAEAAAPTKRRSVGDWLKRGNDIDKELATATASRDRGFAPMFWLKDGEEKTIRIRGTKPVAGFNMYSAHDGKHWTKITQPDEAEDLFLREGRRSYFMLLYEIIDRQGYLDKKTKKQKRNVPRFWLVTDKQHRQLQRIAQEIPGGLDKGDLRVSRDGVKQPAYTFVHTTKCPIPFDKAAANAPRLGTDDNLAKWFAPPTLKEQKVLLRMTDDQDRDDK